MKIVKTESLKGVLGGFLKSKEKNVQNSLLVLDSRETKEDRKRKQHKHS